MIPHLTACSELFIISETERTKLNVDIVSNVQDWST